MNDENLVSSSDVVGIWNDTRLPFLGAALDFLRSSTGFLLCIVAPLAVFFLYELYRFIAVVISMRKPKLTPEMEEELKRQAVEEYLARQNQGGESSTETGQDSAAEDAREDEAALTK